MRTTDTVVEPFPALFDFKQSAPSFFPSTKAVSAVTLLSSNEAYVTSALPASVLKTTLGNSFSLTLIVYVVSAPLYFMVIICDSTALEESNPLVSKPFSTSSLLPSLYDTVRVSPAVSSFASPV